MKTQIHNMAAYQSGQEQAKALSGQIRKSILYIWEHMGMATVPPSLRAEVAGDQFRLYAPHGLCTQAGDWRAAGTYSYIPLCRLNLNTFEAGAKDLAQQLADSDEGRGVKDQLMAEFPATVPPGATDSTPPETAEQKLEKEIKRVEEVIANEGRAVGLAESLGLARQRAAHEDELAYQRKTLAVVRAGYAREKWLECKYSAGSFKDFHRPIPLGVLEAYAAAAPLFDDFRVWVGMPDGQDPLLIGRIINGEKKTSYLIDAW